MSPTAAKTGDGIPTSLVAVGECFPRNGNRDVGDHDKESLAGLAASIEASGLLQPILLRLRKAGGYEIVCGERRWLAYKQLKRAEIPARVREMTDQEADAAVLIENLQRKDLHPLDELAGYERLLAGGATAASIAGSIGQPVEYITQRLALAKLTPEGRKAMVKGTLDVTRGWVIARLQPADQAEALKMCLGPNPPSVRGLQRWIADNVLLRLSAVPWQLTDGALTKAGPCTVCPKRTGNQPGLFPDTTDDTCTDSVCFQSKLAAVVASAERALKDPKHVKITTDTYSDTKGVVARGHWANAAGREKCDKAVMGLVVESRGDLREIGRVFPVCVDRTCKKHHGGGSTSAASDSPAAKARRKKEIHEQKRTELTRHWLFALTLAQATKVLEKKGALPTPLARFVAERTFARLTNDDQRILCRELGLKPVKVKSYGMPEYEKAAAEFMEAKKGNDGTLLVAVALVPSFRPPYTKSDPDRLVQMAKTLGVDPKAAAKAADAALEARATKREKKAAKPKKGARPTQ